MEIIKIQNSGTRSKISRESGTADTSRRIHPQTATERLTKTEARTPPNYQFDFTEFFNCYHGNTFPESCRVVEYR